MHENGITFTTPETPCRDDFYRGGSTVNAETDRSHMAPTSSGSRTISYSRNGLHGPLQVDSADFLAAMSVQPVTGGSIRGHSRPRSPLIHHHLPSGHLELSFLVLAGM